jgi:hypothetical protein
VTPLPSASRIDRAIHCTASVLLPQVDESGPAADRGTAIHRYLATGELPEDVELRAACEVFDRATLPTDPALWAANVAFAWDCETDKGRELGRHLNRQYPETAPTEYRGEADVVGMDADGETVAVIDFKSGWSRKTPAHESMQLRMLALGACRAYGRSRARVALCHLRDDGSAYWEWAELDAFELEASGVVLRALAAAIAEGDDKPRMGEWCRYCPAFRACPAQTALIRHMSWEPAQTAEDILSQLTPERAALAYQRLQQVREAMKRVDAALHAWAKEHPIQLPNGQVFGPVATTREVVSGDVAYRVLSEKYGQEVALAACEMSASKASIERALKPLAAKTGEKVTHLKRAALEALGAAGGLEEKVSVTVREHAP